MGFEKAINSGKEHRKPYHGAKAVDHSCRNHGSCTYCRDNRLHRRNVLEERAKYSEKEIGMQIVFRGFLDEI